MLESIIGMEIQEIYMYKNILCLSLGECIDSKAKLYRFDLEIQSPFRFTQADKIVFGSYEGLWAEEESEIEIGVTKIVKAIVENLGDLRVEFEEGVTLEVFIDTREKSENWRLSDNLKDLQEDTVFNQEEKTFAQKAQKYKMIEKFLIRNAY